jgi:conflict system STAND superfamily ATPase
VGSRPVHLKVFISSPDDVYDERMLAIDVINRVQYDPFVRGLITLEAVAWDWPAGVVALPATMTPQAAITGGLTRPSDCDIVIVILWARMGTPLPYPQYQKESGAPYRSGTDWEFHHAIRAAAKVGRPHVLVYERTQRVLFDPDARDFDERVTQRRLVQDFFAEFSDTVSGAAIRGRIRYSTPDEFRQQFELQLRSILKRVIGTERLSLPTDSQRESPSAGFWEGSPFPGLRAFTPVDAPIFFGRGHEIDEIVRKISEERFVSVTGSSGSGKSSIVGAGGHSQNREGGNRRLSSLDSTNVRLHNTAVARTAFVAR